VEKAKQSMKLVLDPRVSSADLRRRGPLLTDYVEVPRLETYGTWRLMDMLPDQSMYNLLTTYNQLTRRAHKIGVGK
jgi:hypothetical protein